MKKLIIIIVIIAITIVAVIVGVKLQDINKKNENLDNLKQSETLKSSITKEIAYEGVYNYCHDTYGLEISEDTHSNTYLAMGDETESEYKVIFRSATGAFTYFYVDKSTAVTRLVEYVPVLNIESEVGTINLFDYLNK